jgi:N-acetylglutamate synthase-like GNAT family acetyltransferase
MYLCTFIYSIIIKEEKIMTFETTTTITMTKETLIKIKSLAVKKGTTQKNIINELLNEALNRKENETIKSNQE